MSVILGGPSTPPPKKKGRGKGKKQKGWEIEIEELWKPNEEEREHLAKNIDWKKVIQKCLKPEMTDKQALKVHDHFKDLLGTDRMAEIMMANAENGSLELFQKIARKGVHWY